MKRTRSESSPTTLKSVRFDENLSNSQLNSGNAKDIEEKKSPHSHKRNKTEKMQDSQSSISEVLTSPNTKFYAVAGDGIVVVSLDDVMAYCQANKRIKKPNPNRRRESKQKTIDLLEDIMKEIALFQHMILNRPKGLLSDLLQMKEVEKINFLSSCLAVDIDSPCFTSLSKEDTVAFFINQIGRRLLQIKVELTKNNPNPIRTLRLTQLVNDIATFLIQDQKFDTEKYSDLWADASSDTQTPIQPKCDASIPPPFQLSSPKNRIPSHSESPTKKSLSAHLLLHSASDSSHSFHDKDPITKQGLLLIDIGSRAFASLTSKRRGVWLQATYLLIFRDEKFQTVKEQIELTFITSIFSRAFSKTHQTHLGSKAKFCIVTPIKSYKLVATNALEMAKWMLTIDQNIVAQGFISKIDEQEQIQLKNMVRSNEISC